MRSPKASLAEGRLRLLEELRTRNRAEARARRLGEVVERRRHAVGLTVRACATVAGLTPSTWHDIARGRMRGLDPDTLSRVAAAVGTTAAQVDVEVDPTLDPSLASLFAAADSIVVLDHRLRSALGSRPGDLAVAALLDALHEAALVLGELAEYDRVETRELATSAAHHPASHGDRHLRAVTDARPRPG